MSYLKNTKSTIIILWCLAVVSGTIITIIVDYVLSIYAMFLIHIIDIRFIALVIGSVYSGFVVKKNGWLSGLLVSIGYILSIVLVLFYAITNPDSVPPMEGEHIINWLSYLPTAMLLVISGIICGYLGTALRRVTIRFRGEE